MRRLAWVAALVLLSYCIGMASDARAASGVDFETAPDFTCSCLLFADDGFVFQMIGSGTITCPCFAAPGPPVSAFVGCADDSSCSPASLADGVLSGQGVGCRYLTDDLVEAGTDPGDLLITFAAPVKTVSGDLIDVDGTGGSAEAFTLSARDCDEITVDTAVVSAPAGTSDPTCEAALFGGPGDGAAAPFALTSIDTNICSVRVTYTGVKARTFVDWAIDNIVVDVDLPPHGSTAVPVVPKGALRVLTGLLLVAGVVVLFRRGVA